MLPDTTDVLVIGAGPAGLTAAVSLAARGRGVIVADSQPEGQNTSRASVVYPRTLELLDPYGVAEPLAARGIHARRFTIRDHDRILMTVPFDRLPTAYPYTLLVSQAIIEAVLLQRLGQLGTQVYRPHTLTGLRQDATGVTASFADGGQVRARYLVGADGMHSAAQTSATSYSLADVHLSGGLPAGQVAVYFSPEGQLVSVPFPDGTYKIVANVADAPPTPTLSFIQDLVDARGPQAEPVIVQDIVWGSRFRIHHGVADRFHTGRVALAGDAAHDNSPLGGQGMNAGIGDAAALGAALDAAIERGSPAPLDAYTATRRPIARQIVTLTNGLTRLATMDRQLRTARNAALATLNPFLSRRWPGGSPSWTTADRLAAHEDRIQGTAGRTAPSAKTLPTDVKMKLTIADAYELIIRGEVIPGIEARRIPGFRSIDLVRRDRDHDIELMTLVWFDTLDSVKGFMGEDYETAHVPQQAREVLADFDKRSAHYDVLDRREQPP